MANVDAHIFRKYDLTELIIKSSYNMQVKFLTVMWIFSIDKCIPKPAFKLGAL